MAENMDSVTEAFKRADDYAHRIMDSIREQHRQDHVKFPELPAMDDADYERGVEQFRSMALHHLSQADGSEMVLTEDNAEEFIEHFLQRGNLNDLPPPPKV